MSAKDGMNQYLDLFFEEADEQLEILESETLKLETDQSQERLQKIFRAAHTIKGSSRAMGFENFADLTHNMENVLDLLRQDKLTVDTEIADALLNGVDALKEMRSVIASSGTDGVECKHLIAQLEKVSKQESKQPKKAKPKKQTKKSTLKLTKEQLDQIHSAAKSGVIYQIDFILAEDCTMKYPRVFITLQTIEELGKVLFTLPGEKELEDEKFDRKVVVIIESNEQIDEIENELNKIGELESIKIRIFEENCEASEDSSAKTSDIQSDPLSAQTQTTGQIDSSESAKKAETNQTVRVNVSRLDSIMNLVGELVIDRTRISQIGTELSQNYDNPNIHALSETVTHIARITSDLQDQIMKTRMMPIENVFNRYPRVVRDLAQKLKKDVTLEINGKDTELDRSVIEAISDPLLHIIRNSLDHGLETPEERKKTDKPKSGTITLDAMHQENYIVIQVTDDGKGIDAEKIKQKAVDSGAITAEAASRMTEKEAVQIIFSSGFSTAAEVSDVSGRGVGMDIVKSNIQKLGGMIDVETEAGRGSTFTLRLPLTLAIIRGLLVEVSKQEYIIPLGNIIETIKLDKSEIKYLNNKEVMLLRDRTTPLFRTASYFRTSLTSNSEDQDFLYVVIVGLGDQRVGLIVDRLIGEQEVVIKNLSKACGDIIGIGGATILGNGSVALIMDISELIELDAA